MKGLDMFKDGHSEQVCPRCRRICFSMAQFLNHECFDMNDKLDVEIALANWDGKLEVVREAGPARGRKRQ